MRALVIIALLASTAAAEPTLRLRIEGDDVVAKVVGLPKVEPLSLVDPDADERVYVEGRNVRAFFEDPVAVAFVISGQDHAKVAEAFDRLALDKTVAAGSEALVVSYANEPTVTLPWSPPTKLDGTSLGAVTQRGTKLAAAIKLAYEQLATRSQPRKLMIVVSDGDDPTEGDAVATLRELEVTNDGVLVIALQQDASDDNWNVLQAVTWDIVPASPDDLDAAFAQALHIAGSRFDARFALAKFLRDGKDHRFLLVHEHDELATATLEMPKAPPPPPPSKTWRWLVLLGVIAAFCGVSFLMFRTK